MMILSKNQGKEINGRTVAFFLFKKIIISGPAGPPYFSPKLPKSSGAIWRGEPWGAGQPADLFLFLKK
jgi:hypothetical protein